MNKVLTIVVPTYNAENYLRTNLESFCIKEIMADIEVLVVNDGSTDQSLHIAEEYAARYPDTYRVLTKENGGHGSGINYGIQYAAGEYFKVVDADDWVSEQPFRRLVRTLKTYKADIVYSGFLWAYDNGTGDISTFKTKPEIKKPFAGVEYNKVYSFDEVSDRLYVKMHNMTIRTAILKEHNIHMDEGCYYVDTEYITYPIPYVETICFAKGYVYMYRIGRGGQSISLEKMQKNEANYDRVLKALIQFYQNLGKDIPCSSAKKDYLAGMIARVVAGKMKIALSLPANRQQKKKMQAYDNHLKKICPDVYYKNINWAVEALRRSHYRMYAIGSFCVRKRYL